MSIGQNHYDQGLCRHKPVNYLMTIDNTREPLRQKSCLACLVVFYICRLCERGQLYCSGPCRGRGRQASNRASNRRYSESFKGKRAASNRQRKLRKQRRNNQHCTISGQDKGSNEGCRSKIVTDHTLKELKFSKGVSYKSFSLESAYQAIVRSCLRCGYQGRTIEVNERTSGNGDQQKRGVRGTNPLSRCERINKQDIKGVESVAKRRQESYLKRSGTNYFSQGKEKAFGRRIYRFCNCKTTGTPVNTRDPPVSYGERARIYRW